jgi:hypothetical protein
VTEMKIFISWSGNFSRNYALALRDWLPTIIAQADAWVSARDISPGQSWYQEVRKQIETADAAIICLTRENCRQPWINFEAGALLYRLNQSDVFPVLITPGIDLPTTLSHIHGTKLKPEGLLTLLQALNRKAKEVLNERDLRGKFNSAWPDLERQIATIEADENQAEQALEEMVQDYRSALKYENELFRATVEQEIFRHATLAKKRAHKELDADVQNYHALLVNFYRKAKKNVFSTSLPEYDTTWSSRLGGEILQAHEQSLARVERIFVFNTHEDVTPSALAVMQKQATSQKIDVRIHISEDYAPIVFAANVSRDFTVIDEGSVIGLTQTYGNGRLTAIWHFGDMSLARQLMEIQTLLRDRSKPLNTWLIARASTHLGRSEG